MGAALPFIAIAATVVGALSKSSADHAAADAQSQNYMAQAQAQQYQAGVALQNQQVAKQYADMEKARGEQMAQMKEVETGQRMGAIQAVVGASGLDPGSGSGMRLSDDTLAMGRLDAQTIRYNAAKAAYGYGVQGTSFGNQSNLDMMASNNARAAASMAREGGNLNAFSDIISGGSQVASKWAAFQSVGAFG